MVMTALAPTLEAFFTERLYTQAHASAHTVASYRDTFRLLLKFAHAQLGKEPSALDISDLDAALIGAFLTHLEVDRHNAIRTRNARLAAIRSFFRYASFEVPEHAGLIGAVLAIPDKRGTKTVVSFLSSREAEALRGAPDRGTWVGRRDHALLATALQSGLRVSELTALCAKDVVRGDGAHLRVHGKGRKERCTPLTRHTAKVLGVWLRELNPTGEDPVFPTQAGRALSRYGVRALVTKYSKAAATRCPSLVTKTVTPHTLRHSCAMALLAAGVDTSVIALWLGHEQAQTVQIYLHGDLTIKERAIARTAPAGTPPGRYRAPDKLMAFLEGL
jgi:site-specific recombinase XerD